MTQFCDWSQKDDKKRNFDRDKKCRYNRAKMEKVKKSEKKIRRQSKEKVQENNENKIKKIIQTHPVGEDWWCKFRLWRKNKNGKEGIHENR